MQEKSKRERVREVPADGVNAPVRSSQQDIHPRLDEIVSKHLASEWRQPFHRPTLDVYGRMTALGVLRSGDGFILDSGCGTGHSTRRLARQFPSMMCVGVDRSGARLARGGAGSELTVEDNCVLVRAELASFWRLLLHDRLFPSRHLLLYPNPWPKPAHVTRRWHGHPVFPDLLCLGGEIELRSNWRVYAREFSRAVERATGDPVGVHRLLPEEPVSLFEKKYLERGQTLYGVRVPARLNAAFRARRGWSEAPG